MTISNPIEAVEIISSSNKRKRWTLFEKQLIVQETYHPGVTVSCKARKHGIPPPVNYLIGERSWRKVP